MSFSTEETRVNILGNTREIWEHLKKEDIYELKQVLQELMVNMRKHSRASSVGIRFEQKANTLRVYYTDNGIGFPPDSSFGNGLRNTGNRINSIGGSINFGSGTGGGLTIQIQIPVRP